MLIAIFHLKEKLAEAKATRAAAEAELSGLSYYQQRNLLKPIEREVEDLEQAIEGLERLRELNRSFLPEKARNRAAHVHAPN